MKALVYYGPGKRSWEDVPDPQVRDPEDAVVRVDGFTICGTDLHILRGDVPEVESGRVLGHEAVGTVTEVGPGVRTVRPGDRVLMSCISACGRCRFCREGRYGQCLGGGGWVLGHLIDGVQAEAVRIPFADGSVHVLPESITDEAALMFADIMPTSYEVGVLNGGVRPGDTGVVEVSTSPVVMVTSRIQRSSRCSVVGLPCTPTLATRPPGRTTATVRSKVAGRPTASMATSAPSPPVSSRTAPTTSSSGESARSAPKDRAAARRLSTGSTTTICRGLNSLAVCTAANPMGPAPTTTTVSPGRTRPLRTPTS